MAWAILVLFILFPCSVILCNAETYYASIAKSNHQAQRVIPHQPKQSSSFVDEAVGLIYQLGNHAGYYPIKNSYGAKMFYFFFESRGRQEDPLVLWLSGGPGCSDGVALFYENGPFQINNDLTLRTNEFGWDKVSNVLYVDQPTGTGFSYTTDDRDMRHNEAGVSGDLYDFLQAFFDGHPEFVNNDFYITGQSYAGHYIPVLASKIYNANIKKEGIHINLKGFAIGDGLTNSEYQVPSQLDFALSHKLISNSQYQEIEKLVPDCVRDVKQCQIEDNACFNADNSCSVILRAIKSVAGNINHYDIRKECHTNGCYDYSNMEKFLNLPSVQKVLGVKNVRFVYCNTSIRRSFTGDVRKNYDTFIPPLIESGIHVLIYAGEYDLLDGWLGNLRWLEAMQWSGQKNFTAANMSSYLHDGKEAGLVKNSGPLTFLKVYDAGHLVPMDQPKVSLHMIKQWMDASKVKMLP